MVSGSWSRMPHLMSSGERSRVEDDITGDIPIRLEMTPSSPGHSPGTGFWSGPGPRLGLHVTAATVAEWLLVYGAVFWLMKLTEVVVKVLDTLDTRIPVSSGGHGSVGRVTPPGKGRLVLRGLVAGKAPGLALMSLSSEELSAQSPNSILTSATAAAAAALAALAAAVTAATVLPAACSTFSWWIRVFLCRLRSELVWKPLAQREQK